MVRPLNPSEWPFATDEERAEGWQDPRFDRRKREAGPRDEKLQETLERIQQLHAADWHPDEASGRGWVRLSAVERIFDAALAPKASDE
jgi:hypothetical protein